MTRKGMGYGLGMGYRNLSELDPAIHSRSAKGIRTYSTLINLPKNKNVTYHQGVFQNEWKKDNPQLLSSEQAKYRLKMVDKTKKELYDLIYTRKSYRGERLKDREMLTIIIDKDKAQHLKFLKAHTDWNAVGYWREQFTGKTFDKEKNLVIQVEFLDTKSEYVGNRLVTLLKRLNKHETGEWLLYVNTIPVEESSLRKR